MPLHHGRDRGVSGLTEPVEEPLVGMGVSSALSALVRRATGRLGRAGVWTGCRRLQFAVVDSRHATQTVCAERQGLEQDVVKTQSRSGSRGDCRRLAAPGEVFLLGFVQDSAY